MKKWIYKTCGLGLTAAAIMTLFTGCFLDDVGTDSTEEDKLLISTQSDSDRGDENSAIGKLDDVTDVTEQDSSEDNVDTEAAVTDDRFADRSYANDGTGTPKYLTEGDVAPDFTADLVDGSTFRLSEHDDEVVLLNFFATWCGPCMGEMPAFEMLKADGYDDLAILCVDCMEDARTVDQFVQESGYTFPIAYDEYGTIENYYPTDGIPFTLVIDHGVIRKIYIGAYGAEEQYQEYKSAIDACMQD